MARGKEISKLLNVKRDAVNQIKRELEKERLRSAVQEELVEGGQPGTEKESILVGAIQKEKIEYKKLKRDYDNLKEQISVAIKSVAKEQAVLAEKFQKWMLDSRNVKGGI
eukprot:jgi/Bigna1/127443/aug1.4_g2151